MIVGPGLAPLELHSGRQLGPLDFMRRMLCMRGRANPPPAGDCPERPAFDIWATNPYTTGGPTHEAAGKDEVSLGDLPEMRRLLRAAERAGRIAPPAAPGSVLGDRVLLGLEAARPRRAAGGGSTPAGSPRPCTAPGAAGVSAFLWFGLRDRLRATNPPYRSVR